ncbi:ABC transporter ATP-binding protein [Cryobacterium cheniae]|uniref:ABC transporter ATP-binding protein n=2 Tax=Cryobacterium cheniae TaxID=1259262 RepID=A0A4R8XRN2_9MICO|nr:ABC transporter ATP-binding protein [Cryobacterium cheniae]
MACAPTGRGFRIRTRRSATNRSAPTDADRGRRTRGDSRALGPTGESVNRGTLRAHGKCDLPRRNLRERRRCHRRADAGPSRTVGSSCRGGVTYCRHCFACYHPCAAAFGAPARLVDSVPVDLCSGRTNEGPIMKLDQSRPRDTTVAGAPDVAYAHDRTVSASGLSKRFGSREVVADLSFSVARGHAFGLLGPNGSGKTTTVRLLTGLLTPDSGTTRLFGELVSPANADALRRRIGVQTDTSLYETLSARENLRTWGALYGMSRKALSRRIDEVLNVLGLSDRADSLVGELSKGMRQKLAVGRAVIHEPELLFLDEPTAGLDPEASSDLIDYLKQMIRSLDTTVIICTHQLHGLESLCDDIGIIRNGQLLTSGTVDDLLRQKWPKHRYSLTVGGDLQRAQLVVASVTGQDPVVDSDGRLMFSISDERLVPSAVAALVRDDIPVLEVISKRPTIEQFYFATLDEGSNV